MRRWIPLSAVVLTACSVLCARGADPDAGEPRAKDTSMEFEQPACTLGANRLITSPSGRFVGMQFDFVAGVHPPLLARADLEGCTVERPFGSGFLLGRPADDGALIYLGVDALPGPFASGEGPSMRVRRLGGEGAAVDLDLEEPADHFWHTAVLADGRAVAAHQRMSAGAPGEVFVAVVAADGSKVVARRRFPPDPAGLVAGLTAAGGRIFLVMGQSKDHAVVALDADDGLNVAWRTAVEGSLFGAVTVAASGDGAHVVLGADKWNSLYVFDAAEGNQRREIPLGARPPELTLHPLGGSNDVLLLGRPTRSSSKTWSVSRVRVAEGEVETLKEETWSWPTAIATRGDTILLAPHAALRTAQDPDAWEPAFTREVSERRPPPRP